MTICMRCSEPLHRCPCQRTVPNLGRITLDRTVDDDRSTPMAPAMQQIRVPNHEGRPSWKA